MLYKEFTFIDYLFSTVWLLIFTFIAIYIKQKNNLNPLYKYFIHAFVYKLLMGLLFAVVYVYVYGGGDTLAYWKGANVLNNLFYSSPSEYISELMSSFTDKTYVPSCYNMETGYPPYWIYFEPKSWFVSKFSSFFSFFTFGSYLTLNIFYSFFSFIVSFRFFIFVTQITQIKTNLLLIATLFIPSVSFWCGGVSKDSLTFCFALIFIMSIWKILYVKFKWNQLIYLIIALYILIHIRPFIIIALLIPLLTILIFRLNKNSPFIIKLITRVIGLTFTFLVIIFFLIYSDAFGEFSTNKIIQTAETTYTDFQRNKIYTGKRYELGISDFSNTSLIKSAPLSIATAIYRPFIWESETVLMTLNGIESVFFIIMTFQLLRKKKNKYNLQNSYSDSNRDFIIFSISFVIIFGFFVGLTSGLFGVLSRLKAPILPFFMIFLFQRLLRPIESGDEINNKQLRKNSNFDKHDVLK